MRFDGKELQERFKAAFGFDVKDLTPEQAWVLVLFGKFVRLRCRNNSAFNSYMSRNFPGLTFREVAKVDKSGKPYKGLEIKDKSGVAVSLDESDD